MGPPPFDAKFDIFSASPVIWPKNPREMVSMLSSHRPLLRHRQRFLVSVFEGYLEESEMRLFLSRLLSALWLPIDTNDDDLAKAKPFSAPAVSFWSSYLGNIFRRLFNPSYLDCFSVNFKKLGGFRKLLSISFHMPPSALFYLYSLGNGKRLRRIFRI